MEQAVQDTAQQDHEGSSTETDQEQVVLGRFCVYLHRTDDGVFYVGQGKPTRPWCTSSRSEAWFNHVRAMDDIYEVIVLSWHETRAEALEAERAAIREYLPTLNVLHIPRPPKPPSPWANVDISEVARKGGLAAAAALTPDQRKARAVRAAKARWKRKKKGGKK